MNETTDAKALYHAFLACLILASLPIKNLAYVSPAIYLLILWWHGEHRLVGRVIMLCSATLFVSCIAVLWDHLGGHSVSFPGLLFGILTYAPLFVVLCETFGRTIDASTFEKFAKVCAWFIIFQSVVGVFQFVATGNADAVCGTLGLLDGVRQSITIAQVYFTFIIFAMILFLVPLMNQRFFSVAISSGVLICLLAQSGHQTIFLIVTLVACGLSRISRLGTLVRTVAAAAVMSLLMLQFYPNTIWLAHEWYGKVMDPTNSPKRSVVEGAITVLDNPKNLLIGTGLGQYSSRAALIASDEYLSLRLPQILTGRSDYFKDYIHPSLELFNEIGEGSAMAKPYMSAISLPVELGLVITFVLLTVICRCVFWSARIMLGSDGELGWLGFAMSVGIIFFVLCCFIENYAEFTQAIFVPFILFVVAGSRAQTVLCSTETIRRKSPFHISYSLAAQQLPN